MRHCWSHSNDTGNMIMPGVLLIGVLCVSNIIREGCASRYSIHYVIVLLTGFITLYLFPLFFSFVASRKYKVSSDGIIVKYPFGIDKRYSWGSFSEISLCKIHYASGSTKHILAIRCAIACETCVPKNTNTARAQWSTMTYEVMHYQNLISIYYSPERYAEFEKFCPYPIKDYRSLRDK